MNFALPNWFSFICFLSHYFRVVLGVFGGSKLCDFCERNHAFLTFTPEKNQGPSTLPQGREQNLLPGFCTGQKLWKMKTRVQLLPTQQSETKDRREHWASRHGSQSRFTSIGKFILWLRRPLDGVSKWTAFTIQVFLFLFFIFLFFFFSFFF